MDNWLQLTESQVRVATDARQYYEVLQRADAQLAQYPGWLFWKKYPNGREYLMHALDRRGSGTTRGTRSGENEAFYDDFKAKQADAKLRWRMATQQVIGHARFCKAARINRLPRSAAHVVRAFADAGLAHHFLVIGTHTLYAYETLADAQFLPQILETADLDMLWDAGQGMEALINESQENLEEGALGILKKVDKTYTRNEERTFQAINAAGFIVDFLRPLQPMQPSLIGKDDRINPMPLEGQDWLAALPMEIFLIDQDGMPLTMNVPDPRIFAAHKLWLSERKDRRPGKRDRDAAQARAVADLIHDRAPVLTPLPDASCPAVAALAPQLAQLQLS